MVFLTTMAAAYHAVGAEPATASDVQPAPPEATHVHIFVVGATLESVRPMIDAFSRRDPRLSVTHIPAFDATDVLDSPGDRSVAARAWIEISAKGEARITIADQRAERFLVREIAVHSWPDEVGRETIAQVVESSVAALLENERLGMTRAQASSVLAMHATPPPPPPSPPHHWHSVALFYQGQLFSPQIAFAHGPGLRLQATGSTSLGSVGAWLSAQYLLPQSAAGTGVGVELQAIAARLCVGLERRLGRHVRLGGWLGGGVDDVRIKPRQGHLGTANLTSTRWRGVTVLRAEVRLDVFLGGDAAVSLAPSVEMDTARRHYDASERGVTYAFVDPYTLRPGLTLALEWR